MSETAGRPSTRIDPETAWTVVTDSPLKGMALAREAGTILAWDEGNQLYLFDVKGESLSYSRVPSRILAGAISDEGASSRSWSRRRTPNCSCSTPISRWSSRSRRRRRRRS